MLKKKDLCNYLAKRDYDYTIKWINNVYDPMTMQVTTYVDT